MSDREVFLNGAFISEASAGVSLLDAGFAAGERVVEVSRTYDGELYDLQGHLGRFYDGVQELGVDPGMDTKELAGITRETLGRNTPTEADDVDWQVIHTITPGISPHFGLDDVELGKPTLAIQCLPLVHRLGGMATQYTDGVDLVVVPQRAISELRGRIMSSGRVDHIAARRQAQQILPGSRGVLLDQNGRVTESVGSSLFVVKSGVIQTAPSERVLNGLTRSLVFDLAKGTGTPIEEADLGPSDILIADEAFVSSTIISLMHVRSFNRSPIAQEIGPVTARVRQAFMEEVGIDFVQQAQTYAERRVA